MKSIIWGKGIVDAIPVHLPVADLIAMALVSMI